MIFILFFLQMAWSIEQDTSEITEPTSPIQSESQKSCAPADSVVALNNNIEINGKTYLAGTEIYYDETGHAFYFPEDESADPIDVTDGLRGLPCDQFTKIPTNPLTGELTSYNIPADYALAGPGRKPKKRKSGVTYCYRAVKNAVRGQVTLTGSAAYMAAPQLVAAGYKRTDYKSARTGAICVFGPGGRKTASGGHKYGHIGIKGRSGLINPQSGFSLGRPFIGCFQK